MRNETHDSDRLARLFLPFAMGKLARVADEQARFVHYTTADAAMKILQSREVWLRAAATMNDFMEVRHGRECLLAAYNGEVGGQFKRELETLFPGCSVELERQFNESLPLLQSDTYMICLSEHRAEEDVLGRLSMWRAYGGDNGVAIVLNSTAFLSDADVLHAYSSPVAYLSAEQFEEKFVEMVNGVRANGQFLVRQGADLVTAHVLNMFRFAVLCTKHPGFQEEQEWRVVHSPLIEPSEHLKTDLQSVKGIPQIIVKLPLRDFPDEGFVGASPATLIDRIIIGPTEYPGPLFDAFSRLLEQAGVSDVPSKVVISNIPLRRL